MLAAALPFLGLPKLGLPNIDLPGWAWPTLLAILAFLGLYVRMEVAARERARAAYKRRENERVAREIAIRNEMERRSEETFERRDRGDDALDRLRVGSA